MPKPPNSSLPPPSLGELARSRDSIVRIALFDLDGGATLVALKFPHIQIAENLDALFRARDAGRQLTKLHHRHIVGARDVGVLEGNLCLITEHVQGIDLLEWLEILTEAQVRMPTSVVVEILRAVSSALDAALNRTLLGGHEPLGLTHRDLKPANILIDKEGDVKVIDFRGGLTSIKGRDAKARLLQNGGIRYLSPNRRAGRRSNSKDDIYALGVTCIELLRGRWLRRLRSDNPAHDRYFSQLVATLDNIQCRTDEADNVLRTLLLRMVAYDSEARPNAEHIGRICRRLEEQVEGPSLGQFVVDRSLPILPPLPPRSILNLPVRIYPEQPIDLPTIERPLFEHVKDDFIQWQESEAGWIEISHNQTDEVGDIDREADETEAALRSIQPSPSLQAGLHELETPFGIPPKRLMQVAIGLAALGLSCLIGAILLVWWGFP